MTGKPRFTVNRQAAEQFARSPEVRRYLVNVAENAASEAERRLPYPHMLGGISVEGRSDGADAAVVIHGQFHLWEYGTINHPPRPAVRPGVQTVLSRVGGRWRSNR